MCVRRVGAVGLGVKYPDDSGIPTRSPVGIALSQRVSPVSRARPAPTPSARPPPRRATPPPVRVHAHVSNAQLSIQNTQHLNRDPATPRKVARTRRRISDRPIRAGHRPARVPCGCAPDRPERTGPSNEKKPAHGFKLTAPSTKDNLPKTELNHKSRLPHGNVLERGFTVARGAKRCPCSSVVHLRRLDQGDSSFRAEEEQRQLDRCRVDALLDGARARHAPGRQAGAAD